MELSSFEGLTKLCVALNVFCCFQFMAVSTSLFPQLTPQRSGARTWGDGSGPYCLDLGEILNFTYQTLKWYLLCAREYCNSFTNIT